MSKDKFLKFVKKYKLLIIIIVIIFIISTVILLVNKSPTGEEELKLSDFEKITIYGYLENNLLDVKTLNLKSNNKNLNEIEIIQVQVQTALDNYFSSNPNLTSISADEIYSILSNQYNIDISLIDFHGLVLTNYEFKPETNEIVINNNAKIEADSELYTKFDNFDNQKFEVTKITKLSDSKYKVYGNIVENENTLSSAEVVLSIENDELNIENVTINN